MKKLGMAISVFVLALMLLSAVACAKKMIASEKNRVILLAGSVAWFVVTPLWMKRDHTRK